MAGFVCVELADPQSATHWFGRAATAGDPEAAYNYGLLLIAEHDDLAGGRNWFRQAAMRGHYRAAMELGTLQSVLGQADGEEWLRDPPPPYWDRPAEPELTARAELAVTAAGRRGGVTAGAADLVEILGTWDLITRRLRDPLDPVTWLTRKSGLHATAIEHLSSVRMTIVRPGSAPWPTPAEVEHVLATTRDLRKRLGLN
jgi:TPR repeat protein